MRDRIRRLRLPALALAGVLVVGSGTAYAVANDGSTGHYRTARATKGDVEQVLATSGTVDAAHRADLEFGTSGTVARVKVAVGDTVRAGQVVAVLDTTSLEAAVTKARAGVAKAVAQLASDRQAQADAVSASSSSTTSNNSNKPKTSTASTSGGTGGTSGATAATLQTLKTLKTQQDAVVKAQSAASAAITAARDALATQTQTCADAYQDQPAAGDQSDSTTSTSTSASASAGDTACAAALATVQDRQDDVSAAQDALGTALSALASTLTKALATRSSPRSPAGGSSAARSSSASTGTSGSSARSGGGSSSPAGGASTPTAATLAGDQAQIEQARADLVDARQELRQAVLRSTRSGTVVSLDLENGDDVSAGDAVAVVIGGKAVTVEAAVPATKVDQVKIGQTVRVTTPGESGSAEGRVTAIGLVADTSSGSATYPVTVTVEDPTIPLPAGSRAMLAIVVATAEDVVTVPISAVTRRGDGAIVETWDGATLSPKSVTLGTVGSRLVEVTQGLAPGDTVVLADLDRAITGASDSINDRAGFNGPPNVRFSGGSQGGGRPTFSRAN